MTTTKRTVYIGRKELRAAALELLRLQGFVPELVNNRPADPLYSSNLRATRAVNDARLILYAAARARGFLARSWMRPPRLFGGAS